MRLMMKYFVLKPAGKDVYAEASRAAMLCYANKIEEEDILFSDGIRAWVHEEEHGVEDE